MTAVLDAPTVSSDTTVIEETITSDEPGCQSAHFRIPTCGPVKYRLMDCRSQINVCADVVEHPEFGAAVRREKSTCVRCKREAVDCWRWYPI